MTQRERGPRKWGLYQASESPNETGLSPFPFLLLALFLPFCFCCIASAEEAPETAAPTAPPLRAGFARTDLTPAVGTEMPGGFSKRLSKGIHDPLWAEAAYFNDGNTELAVVGIDLIMISHETVALARKHAETLCGIPASNIMIAASHTHNGGPVVDCLGSTSDPAYCQFAAEKIGEAVAQAHANAAESQVAWGAGHEDTVGFNRRFYMKDGTVKTHPGKMNPDIIKAEGPIDPEVGVISVRNAAGEVTGCIVNYALHGTVIGGAETSADWICYLRETVRAVMGDDVGVVFLNGACGDITQVDNRNPRPTAFGEVWARRIGTIVGAETLKVLARAEYAPAATLGVTTKTLALPIRDLAATDEEHVASEAPASGLGSGKKDAYLREASFVRAMKERSPTVDAEIQAMRIGDVGIASNGTEYFCALGLAIKEGSQHKMTMVSELTNGYYGYCATRPAYAGGGYEVRTARSSYLAPGTGEQVAQTSVELLNQLVGQ
ncbi:MAG: hypothetical protein GY851_29275 [bacterium]|nr:hypothetical protein [bacterium]